MKFILDACAIIAFLRGEQGSDYVEKLLIEYNDECLIHAINICEVYYDFLRNSNEEVAKNAIFDLVDIGIKIIREMNNDMLMLAGKLKVDCKLSLADSFALALAIKERGTLITSDRKEFEPIKCNGIYEKIEFIR